MDKQKVAILGGGIGAMTVAWELSSPENRDKYDITVYQMGWRLGGQGASGRNQYQFDRIEEHGLHAWGGFYENAFRVMGEVYAELGRQPGTPLARLWDPDHPDAHDVAFRPHDNVVFCEYVNRRWIPWVMQFARESGMPGQKGGSIPSLTDIIYRSVELFLSIFKDTSSGAPGNWAQKIIDDSAEITAKLSGWIGAKVDAQPGATDGGHFKEIDGLVAAIRKALLPIEDAMHHKIIAEMVHFLRDKWQEFVKWDPLHFLEASDKIRRAVIVLDFMVAMMAGVVDDNVLENGFVCIEKYDFRYWLQLHGAMEITLDAVIVRGFYDYLFAFTCGDPGRPALSAGTALWHAIRLTLTYRWAVFFHMNAGMGDTVFAPFYQAMKKRGVKFHFFHRVDDMLAAPGKDPSGPPKITQIKLTKQVKLDPAKCPDGEYQPLFDVLGLPCWPSLPLFDQIQNGIDLAGKMGRLDIDLEVPASPNDTQWPDQEQITLNAGTDFDVVVSNLSVAALGLASNGLTEHSKLPSQVNCLKTVPTMAVQMWMTQTIEQLGWTEGVPILTGYQRPLSTWGDMSYLMGRENSGHLILNPLPPKSLAYFCGPLLDSTFGLAGADPVVYGTAEGRRAFESRVKAMAQQWFQDNIWELFPNSTLPTNPTALNYMVLWSPDPTVVVDGLVRFEAQYTRGNIKPCEQYVISAPGDNQFRPREGLSGIDGLYLVGDWIYTALGGCVESAAMAGLMVVRRITGQTIEIFGELPECQSDFHKAASAMNP